MDSGRCTGRPGRCTYQAAWGCGVAIGNEGGNPIQPHTVVLFYFFLSFPLSFLSFYLILACSYYGERGVVIFYLCYKPWLDHNELTNPQPCQGARLTQQTEQELHHALHPPDLGIEHDFFFVSFNTLNLI